ncbi:hypothetical protein LJC38_03335 [Parabacteroides sp. OttesenSCG-928-K15]|nr:hypothetical protein [Parabacteroides sp. OttesenSCG-928-K15]
MIRRDNSKPYFSTEEQEIINLLGFAPTVCGEIKKVVSNNYFSHIPLFDEDGIQIEGNGNGICIEMPDDYIRDGFAYVIENKAQFAGMGYNLCMFEDNESTYYFSLLKNKTDFDFLRWRGTGREYTGHTNKAIIDELVEWKKQRDFIIVCASYDWVYVSCPADMPPYEVVKREVLQKLRDGLFEIYYNEDLEKWGQGFQFYWE